VLVSVAVANGMIDFEYFLLASKKIGTDSTAHF
jgi:hypothetical protein